MIWWHKIRSASRVPIAPAHHVNMELSGWNQKPCKSSTSCHCGCCFKRPCFSQRSVVFPTDVLFEWRRPPQTSHLQHQMRPKCQDSADLLVLFLCKPWKGLTHQKRIGDASYFSEKSETAPLEGLLGEDPPGSFTMRLLCHPLNRSVVIVQVVITRAIICST